MAQAQRVADLVHHRVLDVVGDEALGLRAVGVDLAARLEHVQRIAQLLGRHVAVAAVRVAGVFGMPPPSTAANDAAPRQRLRAQRCAANAS